jgi:hypothetical protein
MYVLTIAAPKGLRRKKHIFQEENPIFRMSRSITRIKSAPNLCVCNYPDKIGVMVEKNYPDKIFFREPYISRGFRGS